MDNRPPVDRSLLVPIFIGVGSIFGIMLLWLGMRVSTSLGATPIVITNTPPKFQYLGTEPGIAPPTELPALEESPASTEAPTEILLPPTATQPLITTPVLPATNTRFTGTITSTVQSLDVTYDDAVPKLNYTGNWIGQSGVTGAYRNTLHISGTIGDAVQLIFYGQKIQLAYQAGPSLGTISVRLDSVDFVLDQSSVETQSAVWESPVLPLANHTITITHISGGSVNLDSVSVIDLSTPVPTGTPTPTP